MTAPGGDFRLAGAYVELNIQDKTPADEERIKERIKGQPPVQLPVKAQDPIDDAWRAKVQASIKSISADAIKIPMSPDTAKYREELQLAVGELSSAVKQKIPVDIDQADQFKLHVEELAKQVQEEVKAKIPVEVDDESAKTSGDKAGKDAADAANKSATTGFKAMPALIASGLLVGAPLIGGALVAGVGIGLAGLAGVVASRNQQVKDSFHQLTDDLSNTADSWSTELGDPVSHAIGLVRGDFDKLAPQIHTALHNVTPEFSTLTGAVTDFADNAVPGMVKSTSNIGPVFDGVRSAAGSLGSSVGSLFTTVSQHSDSIGVSIASVGRVVQTVVNTAGPLIGKLSDEYAQHAGQIEGAFTAVGHTVTGLASGAFPVLGNAIGNDLQVVTSFLNVLGPADQILGTFGGAALSAYTNVRILSTLQGPLQSFGDKVMMVGESGTKLGDFTAKVGSGLDKLGSSLPLVGIGFTVLGLVIDAVNQHEKDLIASGDQLAASLAKGGAAATSAENQMRQLTTQVHDAQSKVYDLTQKQHDLDAAQTKVTTSGGKYADSTSKLTVSINQNQHAITLAQQTVDDNNKVINEAVSKYNELTAAAGALPSTVDEITGKVHLYADSAKLASSNSAGLKSDLDVLQSAASTADQKISALNDQLKRLANGGLESATDAAIKFGDDSRNFADAIGKATGTVLDHSGALNTLSEKGSKVNDYLESSRQDWVSQATAMAAAGKSTDEINATLGENQKHLMDVLKAANLTQPQIDALVKTYGLIPSDISTQVNAPGAKQTADDLQTVSNKLKAIPPGQSVTMTSITADAEARLTSLGFHVTHMPDGSVTVSANTDPAWSATQSLIRNINGSRAVVTVDAVTGNTSSLNFGGGHVASAHGNILKPFADGGFFNGHALTPMAAGVATMVPANTYRVVGDNMTVPEAYIPEDRSLRSRQLLAQTNSDMGNPLGVGQPAKSPTINQYITVRDNDTAHEVAAKVGAGLTWTLQTSRG